MSYQAKDSAVRGRQLKVQSLSIPLSIPAGAASVTVDEPSLLFLRTAAFDGITTGTGALDAGQTAPTFVAPANATGKFAALVRVGEQLSKVVSAKLTSRSGNTCLGVALADSDGIDAIGDKIVLNVHVVDATGTDVNLGSTAVDACLEVQYVVAD
jgi:hypothetical protein